MMISLDCITIWLSHCITVLWCACMLVNGNATIRCSCLPPQLPMTVGMTVRNKTWTSGERTNREFASDGLKLSGWWIIQPKAKTRLWRSMAVLEAWTKREHCFLAMHLSRALPIFSCASSIAFQLSGAGTNREPWAYIILNAKQWTGDCKIIFDSTEFNSAIALFLPQLAGNL